MPWKTVTFADVCRKFGVDQDELLEKQSLIDKIVTIRKREGVTQTRLAELLGISQPRIARIESKIDAHKTSFETLFKIFVALGYSCRLTIRKERRSKAA